MIQQLVEPLAKLDYRTLCESLIRTFGMSEPVKWDSSLPATQQQQLFGGELLRIIADHPTLAQQHDIRALCWPKGTVSQLLFLFVRLNDDKLPKSQIERITRRFVGGLEAERYTVWFFGNPSQNMLKVVLAGREGKKAVCKTLTLEAGQWYKTYDFILDSVGAIPTGRPGVNGNNGGNFGKGEPLASPLRSVEPSVLWKAIWQAFDISIVNKNFYRDIKVAFDSLIASLSNCKGILTRPEQRAQFAVRLLGRLIFCWFLKKKGIVGSNALSSATVKDSVNYYHELLEPLFFDVFNTPLTARKSGLPASIAGLRFLNGGLFEPQTDDCQGNFQLLVPNDWFAGFFGDTMERYNFTVDENSATNAEIAIDPEMLGRIFENLLAEQNPETGASARKQTGSFYTPREIVDYMVEESLIAYLGSECADFIHAGELPTDLKPRSTELLEKLNRLKTIDLAAGSGAFPIGMLQKVAMLKQALNPKASPYDLKLETIENSIYGVDIQPMAIELSRLRCWLSLIVDEEPDTVQPLPNLDFKFVCADSLIDLGYKAFLEQCTKRHGFLFLGDFEDKMKELKKIRHDYFDSAHNHNHKQQLKLRFLAVQNEILKISLDLVKQKLISSEFTNRITGWNPFDDSKAAPFFSPVWMFGVEEGFDISIGNPPYVRKIDKELKKYLNANYKTASYQVDLYVAFIELSTEVMKQNGVISLITPNSWLKNLMMQKLRSYLLERATVLVLAPNIEAAFDAGVTTSVLVAQKCKAMSGSQMNIMTYNKGLFEESHKVVQEYFLTTPNNVFEVEARGPILSIIEKIRVGEKIVSDLFDVSRGINPYDALTGQTQDIIKSRAYHTKYAKDESFVPELKGKHVSPFEYIWDEKHFISYGNWLAAPREPKYFSGERIIFREILGERLVCTIIREDFKIDRSLYIALPKTGSPVTVEFTLGLLASKLFSFYFRNASNEFDKLFPKIRVAEFKALPIKLCDKNQQSKISTVVNKILNKKREEPGTKTTGLEAELDSLVYALYGLTDEEIAVVEGK
ncbi:MAG: TaqI-like C-terminal specificity domain-containing protein [Desulfuromonadales bacterium]